MRKILFLTLVVLLVFCLFACNGKKEIDPDIEYVIDLVLEDNVISAKQTVSYDNYLGDNLCASVFHLYPNCYREDAVNPAYKVPLSTYGGIDVKSITVDGNNADIEYSDNKEYVIVNHKELKKGEEIDITFEYTVNLAECGLRLGYYDGYYNLSNFYPQLAYAEEGAFRLDDYSSVGDPFVSEIADYTVNLTCNKNMVVASSGKINSTTDVSDKQTISTSGVGMRDYCMVLNSDFQVLSDKVGDTSVYYFYEEDENAQDTLNLAVSALKTFSDTFGKYQYPTYSVVRTPFDYEGMEYSGLVYVSTLSKDVPTTVIHETAHQWWYGMVGSDSIKESVLDEGLVTFCTAYYKKLIGNEDKFNEEMKAISRAYTRYEKLQSMRKDKLDLSMDNPIYDYVEYQYYMVIYNKGAMMFDNLYRIYGENKFNTFLKYYFDEFNGKVASLEDMKKCAEKKLGSDVTGLINGWLCGGGIATTFSAS